MDLELDLHYAAYSGQEMLKLDGVLLGRSSIPMLNVGSSTRPFTLLSATFSFSPQRYVATLVVKYRSLHQILLFTFLRLWNLYSG